MKRLVFAIAAAVLLASASLVGQQSGATNPPKPPTPAAKAKSTSTTPAKPQPATSKPASKPAAPKAAAVSKPKPAAVTASAKPAAAAKPTTTAKATTTATAKPATKTASAPAPVKNARVAKPTAKADPKLTMAPGAPLTPIQEKLQKSPNLARKVESRLPAGTNVLTASEGFKNLGQFVAAVNVSNNLNIPFAKLKDKMVKDRKSLGAAIQALRPTSSGTIEAQRAEYDARGMIAESERELEAVNASTTTKTKAKAPSKPKPAASPRATGGRP